MFTFLNNNKIYKVYPYLNNIIENLDLDKNKILIGVDGNLFCYKYSHSYDNMLIGFFNQILQFLSNKIIPLYIFDGGTIDEKNNTNILRNYKKTINKYKLDKLDIIINDENFDNNLNIIILKKKLEKNSIKINLEKIKLLLEMFDLLHIPYIFSHGEGEYLAVLLNKYNIIDLFLSDDTDPIPAGINKMIKFYNNNVYYIDTNEIYNKLKLNKDSLCDFCILLGSDYASFFHGIKPNELYDLIKKHNSIENIIKNGDIVDDNNYIIDMTIKIRNIYNYSSNNEKIMFTEPDKEKNKNYNLIIDHNNLNYYSYIMLEFWDDYINLLKKNDENEILEISNIFKSNINSFVRNNKFNIKNIVKFIKNNINDITNEELNNAVVSFEFLNTFGI